MKSAAVGIAIVLAFIIGATIPSAAQAPQTVGWQLVVSVDEAGRMEFVCEKGCVWKSLWFSCSGLPCQTKVDAWGTANHQDATGRSVHGFGNPVDPLDDD